MPTFSPSHPGKHPERAPATRTTTPHRAPPALLTIPQVADRLGASSRHIQRLIKAGHLPVHRLGRLVRVSEDDLARLIAASRES
jgi:excisionase family DNA binding protein